jgi:prepilin-type N-terminal cleavage/methylation domain-containing protein
VTRPRQTGFTLVELMIVVAVVGVLAAVAIFMFNRQSQKAKLGEVPAVFAELKLRQEQFHLEHNEYLSTAGSDTDFFPTDDPGKDAVALDLNDSAAPPAPQDADYPGPSWKSLRVKLDKTALYCGYLAIAGDGGDNTNVGAVAAGTFGLGSANLPVPAADWFYLMARCDIDGDDIDSEYFTLSGLEGNMVENAGE